MGAPCEVDGWPAGLPVVGVAYVDPAALNGDGSRAAPFATIEAALASTATIAALRAGTHASAQIDRDFTLRGACASGTIVEGLEIVGAVAEIRDVGLLGAIVDLDAELTAADVAIAGSVAADGPFALRRASVTGGGVAATAELVMEGVELNDSDGVEVVGGEARLDRLVVRATRASRAADLHLEGGAALMRDLALAPARVGVFVDGAAVDAERLTIVGGTEGLSIEGDARVVAGSLVVRDAARAAATRGGTIELTDVEVFGGDVAFDVGAGLDISVSVERASIDGAARGFFVQGDSPLSIADAEFVATSTAIEVRGGVTAQLRRLEITARLGGVLVRDAVADIEDLRLTDVFRGVDVAEGGDAALDRVAALRVGVAAIIARGAGTTAAVRDLEVKEGVGAGDGFFGRGIAVEYGGHLTAERVRLEACREVAASALGEGAVLELADITIIDTRPRACANSTCAGQPVGVGIGAYHGAVARVTRFDVQADLACLQELAGARITAPDGTVRDCAVGQYLESTAPSTQVCYDGVETLTNDAVIDPPNIDLR